MGDGNAPEEFGKVYQVGVDGWKAELDEDGEQTKMCAMLDFGGGHEREGGPEPDTCMPTTSRRHTS